MAQTTNFQIDYPVSTDLVKDGASAMGTIATGFDSLLGTAGLGGFRNAIINGDFSVNQRVFTSTTANGTYGFDRWAQLRGIGGVATYSSQAFTVGAPAATGYEATNFARIVTTGQSLAADFALLQQAIEDVRTFAGAQVVVSFWARAGSGTPSVSVEWAQSFGTGGSPSAAVESYVGKIQLSTSWTRYQIAYNVPSISGKTIGTDLNSSANVLRFFTSAGSNYNARTGALGNQNATIDFWGFQVERGTRATPLERRPVGVELALCQRYYEKSYSPNVAPGTNSGPGAIYVSGTSDGSSLQYHTIRFAVPKRTNSYVITTWTENGTGGNWAWLRNGAFGNSVPAIASNGTASVRLAVNVGAAWIPCLIAGHFQAENDF